MQKKNPSFDAKLVHVAEGPPSEGTCCSEQMFAEPIENSMAIATWQLSYLPGVWLTDMPFHIMPGLAGYVTLSVHTACASTAFPKGPSTAVHLRTYSD